LAAALTIPGLTVSREKNSNGHVDLTIEADHCVPARTKLGEAKIYDGPAYHIKGVGQLLKRYATGRESAGLLLNYVQKPDILSIVTKLRQRMDKDLPHCQTGPSTSSGLHWSFVTSHAHSSGENLNVYHVGCNLYVEPDA
jgi:hypothetical protein